jgi:hypothetical protein
MPRENRKRGKKHKKVGEAAPAPVPDPEPELESTAVVIDVQADLGDAPFGYVDPDLKSYFKSVDLKLREWSGPAADDESDQGKLSYMYLIPLSPRTQSVVYFSARLSRNSEEMSYNCLQTRTARLL